MAMYRRIRDLREDADKTQTELALYLGTTAQYYGKYEKGEREIPLARAVQIADYYDVSLDYLTERTDYKSIGGCIDLTSEELNLIEQYRLLSERSRGKHDVLMQQLLEQQNDETHK